MARRRARDTARIAPAVSLIICDRALLDAAVKDDTQPAVALDCAVAEGWVVFPSAIERFRDAIVADPSSARWGPRLFVVEAPRTLVGWGGFKGAPDPDGAVEIGYAIAPSWEGRGVATAAVGGLLDEAWAAPDVQRVVAHTLPAPGASARVLEKNGFARDGENLDGDIGLVWRFRLERGDTPESVPSSRRAIAR